MMETAFECIPCTVQSCLRLLEEGCVPKDRHEDLLRVTLRFLAAADWQRSPPDLARDLHEELRRTAGDPDPYRDIKHRSNLAMCEQIPDLREYVARSADPVGAALRLAVAGNVIDFGAQHLLDPVATIHRVRATEPAIDDSDQLREDLARGGSLLYIGDNAGEIVLDGLFLETLAHPDVTFVVREGVVINDATLVDAAMAGIPALARVITTGDDAPGALPLRASLEFREALDHADVVIAKGQGNLEALWDMPCDVYFLLTVKCERIARHLGVGVGDFVIWKRWAVDG